MTKIINMLNFCYENLFQNLSFSIEKNKFITISGPNNCGKTTIIRILNREVITNNQVIINNRHINDYTIEEYEKIIQCVIPLEIIFEERTIEEELLKNNNNLKEVNNILKKLKLKNKSNTDIYKLDKKEVVLAQLALSLVKLPKILLIDNISSYFSEKEIIDIIKFLKEYQQKNNITIIYTTINLEESIYTDYLYFINNKKIVLEGIPLEILQKDNIINKIGLDLPFMIDLSVKLKDYELIDKLELDPERMVDSLWK